MLQQTVESGLVVVDEEQRARLVSLCTAAQDAHANAAAGRPVNTQVLSGQVRAWAEGAGLGDLPRLLQRINEME